jgi:hypothetical protein
MQIKLAASLPCRRVAIILLSLGPLKSYSQILAGFQISGI